MIIRDKKGRFVYLDDSHCANKVRKLMTVCLALVLAAFIAGIFLGCAPRSELYCLKNGGYVKCPKGVEIGSEFKNGKWVLPGRDSK